MQYMMGEICIEFTVGVEKDNSRKRNSYHFGWCQLRMWIGVILDDGRDAMNLAEMIGKE